MLISYKSLDLHANIFAIDQNSVITIDAGWEVEVSYFNLEYKVLSKILTVDTIIKYDSMHTGVTYLIKVRKTLNVLSMDQIIMFLYYDRCRHPKKRT